MSGYAELAATSNFSFLEGASHPRELVEQAKALQHAAIGIADRNSFAGLVRGMVAAEQAGLGFVAGVRLRLDDGHEYLAWPADRPAYGRLSHLISTGRMAAPKGECHIDREALIAAAEGLVLALVPPDDVSASQGHAVSARQGRDLPAHQGHDFPARQEHDPTARQRHDVPARQGRDLAAQQRHDAFAQRLARDAAALRRSLALPLFCAATYRFRGDDRKRLDRLAALAAAAGTPLLAAGGTRFHHADRRRLADVLAAIRLGTTVDALGYAATPNAEAHLKPAAEMRRLFAGHEDAVDATLRVVATCRFSLRELAYEYPDEILDAGCTPQQTLARRVAAALQEKWPAGPPAKVATQIAHELGLIERMGYAPYFLTVHEIVRFAVGEGILCQGRGSAANSAVCYVLGITSVAPDKHDLLFERFISESRNEPPDIDVDFEHERREEVIQHIYARYGRDRAAIAATIIRYRDRSAIREVGRAMGLSEDVTGRLAKSVWGAGGSSIAEIAADQGLDPEHDPRLRMACELTEELLDFPRHLATHVGGFVITRGRLTELAIVTRAAMADRHTIEWDKDDIEALRILKVDVLGLGMLSCIRRAFDLVARHGGTRLTLQAVPQDDAATYTMLRRADSIGVFQVESRAQMNMLPRLQPKEFYDLVIEVAIVRPGPIQGDMVHPYLRRRNGEEPVTYPSKALEAVLRKTLGVPLFQEQAMQIAIVGAGFTASRADELRRAMATFRHVGTIWQFQQEFIAGMVRNGIPEPFAERCFRQIEGFGTYGFPESHAAAFAQLVYVSAWLKRHHPAAFACALLNSQPMGFYAPAQIVRDAREHGVAVCAADALESDWDCTLEPDTTSEGGLALRLGLRQVQGLSEAVAKRIVAARAAQEDDLARAVREGDLTCAVREDDPAHAAQEDELARAVRQSDPAHVPRKDDLARPTRSDDPAHAPQKDELARAAREDDLSQAAREAGLAQATEKNGLARAARDHGMAWQVRSLADLVRRAALDRGTVERLAAADAFRSLGLGRRAALWEAAAVEAPAPTPRPPDGASRSGAARSKAAPSLQQGDLLEPAALLPDTTAGEATVLDYASTGLSLRHHPLALLRPRLAAEQLADTRALVAAKRGAWLRLPGLVLVRQRPGSAKGVVFFTVEDEWGIANLVVYPNLAREFRAAVVAARLVVAEGRVERHEAAVPIIHLIVRRLIDRSELLAGLAALDDPAAGPWRRALARADEVERPDLRGDPRVKLPPSRDFH